MARIRGSASESLVSVWKLLAAGREDEARAKLLRTWSWSVDALAGEQAASVAVRLLERLAPSTDDPDGWTLPPDEITVYRAGMLEGFAWTTRRDTAESLARRIASGTDVDVLIRTGVVEKRHVLAFITDYGEDEIIARPERVKISP